MLISASLVSWIPSPSRWKPMHAGVWRVNYPLILRIRSGESHHSACCSLLPSAKWSYFQVFAFILNAVLILIYERGVLGSNLWLVMLPTPAFIVKQLMCLLGRLVVTKAAKATLETDHLQVNTPGPIEMLLRSSYRHSFEQASVEPYRAAPSHVLCLPRPDCMSFTCKRLIWRWW